MMFGIANMKFKKITAQLSFIQPDWDKGSKMSKKAKDAFKLVYYKVFEKGVECGSLVGGKNCGDIRIRDWEFCPKTENSCGLDAFSFTSEQLRKITNKLDELNKVVK